MRKGLLLAFMERIDAEYADETETVREFAKLHILSRSTRHDMKSMENFTNRLGTRDDDLLIPDDTERARVMERAIHGSGIPVESLCLLHDERMGSIELGRVTGMNDEEGVSLLDVLDEQVASAIQELGGVMFEPREVRIKLRAYNIQIQNPNKSPEAVLATVRELVGMCGRDTRIMRRASYVLPLEKLVVPGPSGELRALKKDIVAVTRDGDMSEWSKRASEVPDLCTDIGVAIKGGAGMHLSTTYYAVDREVNEMIAERDKKTRELYKKQVNDMAPHVIEAREDNKRRIRGSLGADAVRNLLVGTDFYPRT